MWNDKLGGGLSSLSAFVSSFFWKKDTLDVITGFAFSLETCQSVEQKTQIVGGVLGKLVNG